MHPANLRPRKPDKLSQGAHNQTSYPKIQWENTLHKKRATEPQGQDEAWQWESGKPESENNNNREECKVKEQEQGHMTTPAAGS